MMDHKGSKSVRKARQGQSCNGLAWAFAAFFCIGKYEEGIGMDFAAIYNMLMTVAVGFIAWSLKELYSKSEKRHDAADESISKLEEKINDQQQNLYREFVTKDDHYRDINALEAKIDNIKDILMDIKEDIGQLTGKGEAK